MMVKEYRITHLADPDEDPINQWQIQISLEPTWIERHFMGKIFPERRTIVGSCTTWLWGDGKRAGYFWSLWAHQAVLRHGKTGGATYVNSRFNR